MKYGKLDDWSGVDFSLPEDHVLNGSVLSGVPFLTDIRMGGTMWNIPAWIGSVYPAGTKRKDFLRAYGQQFSTIELNATHYKIPERSTVLEWRRETNEEFLFCPKFPQTISHYRRFRNCSEQTDQFLSSISNFGEQIGPAFIQLPPHFGPTDAEVLKSYLRSLPVDMSFAIEFRHPGWFEHGPASDSVWDLLTERDMIAIVSDTAGRRDAVHMRLTSPRFILRFGGNGMDETDKMRLTSWAERTASWSARGLHSFHLWMHQPDSIRTPEACIWFADEISRLTGREILRPRRVGHDLFTA